MNQSRRLDPKQVEKGFATLRSPLKMYAFQTLKMPLGTVAGLRVDAIDASSCTVSLPGGWRTRNPFGSMYWAAQGMAAEMATGLHGFVLTKAAPVPVRMILAGCEGEFTHQCLGRGRFVFSQGQRIAEAIEETLGTGESLKCSTDVVGYDPEGVEVSRWTFTWAFRARLPKEA